MRNRRLPWSWKGNHVHAPVLPPYVSDIILNICDILSDIVRHQTLPQRRSWTGGGARPFRETVRGRVAQRIPVRQRGTGPPGGIADKLIGSLARTLRERGGIPSFDDIARIVAQGRELGVLAAFGALDDLGELQGGHRHTKIAAEVAKTLIVQWDARGWNVEAAEIPTHLAEASCSALIERYYFAKARQPLLAEGKFGSYDEGARWQGQIEQVLRPQLSKLAAKLEKTPDGTGLRAPSRLTKRERTKDLLAESIPGMQPSGQPTFARP